jgi:hypothetical protein
MYSSDFDPDEWCLPPLDEEASPSEPPPFHGQPTAGVFIGSALASVRFTRDGEFVDLGEAVVEGFAAVQPGLVELARLGSTDFAALTATGRVDALIALERQRAWLDGVQQQLLAEGHPDAGPCQRRLKHAARPQSRGSSIGRSSGVSMSMI